MKTTKLFAGVLAASLLAACGGHAGSSLVPQPKSSSRPTDGTRALVTLVIPAHTSSSARRAQYISPSTKSIRFSINDTSGNWQNQWSGSADVTPGSPGCSTDSQGNTTCTLAFGAVGGNVQYTISAYDQTGGMGTLLGAASASATFVTGQDNKFSITLDGVATKITLGLEKASLPAGTPADDALTISAYDADGNLIVNSPNLADANGTEMLSGYTLDTTNVDGSTVSLYRNGNPVTADYGTSNNEYALSFPFTGYSLHYDGGILKNAATLKLSLPAGITGDSTSFAIGPPTNSASMFYVSACCTNSGSYGWMDGFAGGLDGNIDNVTALDSLSAPNVCNAGGQFHGVTTDADNNVAYIEDAACGYQNIVGRTPGTGTAWVIGSIGHPGGSGLLAESFISLGFDSSNNIYAYEDDGPICSTCTTDAGTITVLKAGSNGTFSTGMDLRAITCVNAPEAVAVGPDGTVYAAHIGDGNTAYEAIEVFAPGATGYFECAGNEGSGGSPVTAERYVGGTSSGLDKVMQLALDSSGNLYAANNYGNSITVYGPSANGDVAPDRTIAGPDTGISSPTGVAIDQFGNIYVVNSHQADSGMPTITVYAPGATGDAKPARTIIPGFYGWNGNIALIK